ncbi:hypothetical protein LWF15_33385 [Kineosporia rhizophila]|uniref:hypothetical protein n=1 Tax=Kineosporia rhizophila TaxID=84633 RepID=UPI001E61950B|nr:hypothetical protein [Kineosporia rhizophila]MCE0540398.1 hypothetical protein [Kineosporia rhizophila]
MLVLGITIVVLALAALFLQEREDAGGQERYPDVTGTPSLAPPVSDPPSAGERSQRCGDGLAPPSSDRPTAAPADLQLRVENRALIPVSDTFGPAERSGDVWRCFAHTPMGAVMAAQVISTRRVASPYRVAVGQEQLVANTGRETFLAAARQIDDVAAQPGTFVQPAGFTVRAFAEDSAVVALASRTASGQLRSATITLRWVESEQVGGDWKVELLPDGSDTPALTPLSTLDGYLTWGL